MAGRWEARPFAKRELEEVRRLEGNSRCMDCGGHDTDWGGVSFGILLCMRCAGRHRSLGAHISVIKSVNMDRWEAKQVQALLLGGNGQLQGWFDRCQVSNCALETKYVTNAATIYRQKLAEAIAAGAHPEEASDDSQGPIAEAAAEALRKESRRAERAAAKERRVADSHGNSRNGVGGSSSGRGRDSVSGGGGDWGGNARRAAPQPRRAQPGLEGQAAMAGTAAGGGSHPAAAPLVRRLGNGEYEATFYDGSMGFTLVRDASGRALVTKIAPGGQAYALGVRVGDFLVGLAGDRVYEYDEIMMRIPGIRRPMGLLFEGAGGIPPAGAAVASAATVAAAPSPRRRQQADALDRRRDARPAENRSRSRRGDAGRQGRRRRERQPSPVAAATTAATSSSDASSGSTSSSSSYESRSGSEDDSPPEKGGNNGAANGGGRKQQPAAVPPVAPSAAATAVAAASAAAAVAAEANDPGPIAVPDSSEAAASQPVLEGDNGSVETGDIGSDGGGGVAQILRQRGGTDVGTKLNASVVEAAGPREEAAADDAAAAAEAGKLVVAAKLAPHAAERANGAAATAKPARPVTDEEQPSGKEPSAAAAALPASEAAANFASASGEDPKVAGEGGKSVLAANEEASSDVAATTEAPQAAGATERLPPVASSRGDDVPDVDLAAAASSEAPLQSEPAGSDAPGEVPSPTSAAPGDSAAEAQAAEAAVAEKDGAPNQAALAAAEMQQSDDRPPGAAAAAAATVAEASANAPELGASSGGSSRPVREPAPAAAAAADVLAAGAKVAVRQSRGSRWRKAVLGRRHGDGSWKVKYSDGLEEKHVDPARIRPRESSGGRGVRGGSSSSTRKNGGGGGGGGERERARLAAPPPEIPEAWAAEPSEGGREALERYAPHDTAQLDDGFFASDGFDSDGMQERMRDRSDRNRRIRLEAQAKRQAASAAAALAAAQGTATWPGADATAAAAGSNGAGGGGQEFDATFGPGPLGLTLTKDVTGGGVVTRVAAGGAAEAQGVRAGDRLTQFAGRSAPGFEQVMAMVRTSARPLTLSFRPRMIGIGGGYGPGNGGGGTLSAPAVTWADVGIGAAIGVMDAANTVAVGLGLGRPTSPIQQQATRALPPGSVGFAPPPSGGRAYLGPAAGMAGGASTSGFIPVPTAIAGGYGNSIGQYRTVTVDVPITGPAMSTRQALADEPEAADGEMDVVFEEGKLGMRLEERGAHRVFSVVTRVDPEGQAQDQGVVEGSVVLGVNGERFLSHAHTIATLMHGRRPVALRLRVGVPDDAYR